MTWSSTSSSSDGVRVQELCESRGGRPGLSILTSLLASVDVKLYWTMLAIGLSLSLVCQPISAHIKQHNSMLRHWFQFVPNMSADIRWHEALHHHHLMVSTTGSLCLQSLGTDFGLSVFRRRLNITTTAKVWQDHSTLNRSNLLFGWANSHNIVLIKTPTTDKWMNKNDLW